VEGSIYKGNLKLIAPPNGACLNMDIKNLLFGQGMDVSKDVSEASGQTSGGHPMMRFVQQSL
jgi:hypothetical protein